MTRFIRFVSLLLVTLVAVSSLAEGAQPTGRKTGPPIRTPDQNVGKRVWSWKALKQRHVVMQQYDYSCGAAALATVARYYWGDPVTEEGFLLAILATLSREEVRDRMENGLSMTDLKNAAVAGGYQAVMGRRTLAQMTELKAPVIVRLVQNDYEHFVVFRGVLKDRVFIADPIRGNLRMSIQQFDLQWQDDVILVMAKPDTDLPKNAPLALKYHSPVQPELQPVRRLLMDPLRDPK